MDKLFPIIMIMRLDLQDNFTVSYICTARLLSHQSPSLTQQCTQLSSAKYESGVRPA